MANNTGLNPNCIFLVCLFLLTACGGGGRFEAPNGNTPSQPTVPSTHSNRVVVSLYGDSLTVGAIAIKGLLDVPPTERLQEILGEAFRVELRGTSGAVARQAVLGDFPRWLWAPFQQQIALDGTNVAVIRFGGADAILGTEPEAFRKQLTMLAQQAKAAHAKVLIVGVIPSPTFVQGTALMDTINREVAKDQEVAYINLRDLDFDPVKDIAAGDAVHPSQAFSDRIVNKISRYIQ